MTQPPYEPTREIPRIRPPAARPSGYVPTPETRPARSVSRRPAEPPRERDYRLDPGLDILTPEAYPSPRSTNPLHRYGPIVFVGGAVVFVVALLLILLKILGAL